MAFKATRYFVLIAALVIAGTRYMNEHRQRLNFNDDLGIWDSKEKDGLRYTIVTRSNETDGKFFLAHSYCTSKAQGFYPGKPCSPPQHFHDSQDEEFEAISGVLMVDWNGTAVQIPVGEKRTIPAGLPHTFWNGGSEPLEVLVRMTPGLPSEGFLEVVAALSNQFGGLGRVNPMQLVLLFADYGIILTELPQPVWLAAKRLLVPLARLLGLKSFYPAYVSKAGQPLPVPVSGGQQQQEHQEVVPAAVEQTEAAVSEPVAEKAVEAGVLEQVEVEAAVDQVADETDKSEL